MRRASTGTGNRAWLIVAVLSAVLPVAIACGSPPASGPVAIESPFAACPATLGGAGSTGPDTRSSGPGTDSPVPDTRSSGPGTDSHGPEGGVDAPGGIARVDGEARPLPAVSLPCFTGGEQVTLSKLGQPAVINFWASYCQPCRRELRELQRFADATDGRILVIGVITNDTRTAAAAAGVDFEVRFASVFDAGGALERAWGRSVLPVTLFVDARGQVRHEDLSGALTQGRVADLAARYLGVTS
jgi:thiol-disulfide isomerase/thioredoxin